MVAPHDTGDLVRSLVRVPGSGHDRTMASVAIDLSKVSSYAATVPVSQTLPPAIARPLEVLQQSETTPKKNLDKIKPFLVFTTTGATNTSKRTLPQQEVTQGVNSVTRTGVSGVNHSSSPTFKRRIVRLSPQQIGQILQGQRTETGSLIIQQQELASTSTNVLPTVPVDRLLYERDALREENKALQQRVAVFQQLFRDKERLTSVLRRLGVNVQ